MRPNLDSFVVNFPEMLCFVRKAIQREKLNGDIVTEVMFMPNVTQEEILKMVELQLGKRGVRENDWLVETLGAESTDVANLVAAAEEKYGIAIKESELARIHTPQDLFTLVLKKLE